MRGVLLSSSRPWYCSTPFHVDLAFLRSLDGGAGPTVTGDVAPGDVTRKLVFALPSVAGDVLSAPRLLPGEQAALSRFEASKVIRQRTKQYRSAHLENVHIEMRKNWHLLRKDTRQALAEALDELQERVSIMTTTSRLTSPISSALAVRKSCVKAEP